jgi:hypothetical protein
VDPPFVGVAVKVTEVPEQTVLASAAIETLAVTEGVTNICTVANVPKQDPPSVAVNVNIAVPL